MTIKMRALKRKRIGGRWVSVGELFQAGRGEARTLRALGWALPDGEPAEERAPARAAALAVGDAVVAPRAPDWTRLTTEEAPPQAEAAAAPGPADGGAAEAPEDEAAQKRRRRKKAEDAPPQDGAPAEEADHGRAYRRRDMTAEDLG